jgi:hypothetical protein
LVSITKWLIYGLVGAFALSSLIDPARAQGTVSAFSGIGGVLGNLGAGLKSLGQGAGSGAAGLLNPLWTLRDLIYGPQAGVQTPTDIQQATSTGIITTPQQNIRTQTAIQLDPNAPFTPVTTGFGGEVFQQTQEYHPILGQIPREPLGITPYSYQVSEQGAALAADHTIRGFSYSYEPGLNPQAVTQAQVHGVNVPLTAQAVEYYQSIGVDVSPANPQTVAANNPGNATGGGAQASANSSGGGLSSAAPAGGGFASGGGFGAAN